MNTQWEVLYAHQPTVLETLPSFTGGPLLDIDVDYLQFGGTFLFDNDSDTTVPFIAMTAGLARFEPGLSSIDAENYLSGSLGGGVHLRANRRVGVRLEARAFLTLVESDSTLFCVQPGDECVRAIGRRQGAVSARGASRRCDPFLMSR